MSITKNETLKYGADASFAGASARLTHGTSREMVCKVRLTYGSGFLERKAILKYGAVLPFYASAILKHTSGPSGFFSSWCAAITAVVEE